MIKKRIRRLLGEEIRRNIVLEEVAAKTKISWRQIDCLEIGRIKNWTSYQTLLDFYGKEIRIELVDKEKKAG